jgi:hypothetical protein
MLLVFKKNVRLFDATNDIVVMVQGSIRADQRNLLAESGMKVVKVLGVSVGQDLSFDNQPNDSAATCYRSKLCALQLVAYDKILFMDADIFLKEGMLAWFSKTTFIVGSGRDSPMNAGVFVAKPSQQAYADIRDIAKSGTFTLDDGWMQFGSFPHWREEGQSDWTFWCSTSDKGLLFYYYGLLMHDAEIISVEYSRELYIHFTGMNKPFLFTEGTVQQAPRKMQESLGDWFSIWHNVELKLSSSQKVIFNSKADIDQAKETIENVRVGRRMQAKGNPY